MKMNIFLFSEDLHYIYYIINVMHLQNVIWMFWPGMKQRVVDPRMFFKVEEEVKTKAEQLKALRARENFLQQKFASATTNEEEVWSNIHKYI